jgi:hypothetical protein
MKQITGNLEIVKERFPELYSKIINTADNNFIEFQKTKQGNAIPIVSKEGKRFFVHSRFDPVTEAERFINEIDINGFDLFVVFGFGFAYHIECLMRRMGKDSLVLIIEKSPSMLRLALECRELSLILKDSRLILLLDPNEDSIALAMKGKSSRRASLILHRGSYQIEQEYYSNMQGIVRSYLSTKEVNIATLAKFEKIWASNIARNVDQFIRSPAANIFFDKFRGIPAIIACAGPSLLKSLDFIRDKQKQALIVAVDTSYKILVKHGIEPHFCIAVDPQVVNARYFEGTVYSNTILISDPMVHPTVFRYFKGRVVMAGIAFDLLKWIETFSGEKGEITHGGSVSTNAYDFTRRTGASPVILVGQDLAFTGGYAHARGSHLDEQVYLRTCRFYGAEMFNRFQLNALPKIRVRGIRSETVQTNQKMMIFLSWFEKQKNNGLVNASYDGARIPGIRHAGFEEITMPEPGASVSVFVEELYQKVKNTSEYSMIKRLLMNRINIILSEIDALIPELEKAVEFSESLGSIMRDKRGRRKELDVLLKKLSETDRIVESKKYAKDMISFTIQHVVHTIAEGYDIDETDPDLSEEERVAKRSQYLYRGLFDGAHFNRKILKKMSALLE